MASFFPIDLFGGPFADVAILFNECGEFLKGEFEGKGFSFASVVGEVVSIEPAFEG